MWMFTTIGFFSAVRDRDQPEWMSVRARVKADAENLIKVAQPILDAMHGEGAEVLKVTELKGRDYPYRVYLTPDEWALVAAKLTTDIEYTNFKDEVKKTQGKERASLYMGVWSAMYGAEGELERLKQPKGKGGSAQGAWPFLDEREDWWAGYGAQEDPSEEEAGQDQAFDFGIQVHDTEPFPAAQDEEAAHQAELNAILDKYNRENKP